MNISHIITFRMYAEVTRPVGNSIEFRSSDPIIKEFFQSLEDFHPYSPNHDRVVSRNHHWFLEVADENITIHISCYIPYREGDIVVGTLGKFSERNDTIYGHFQSEMLYQWYQKYSHRWLTPEEPSDP
jgi:hypothetical protein